MTKPRAGSFWAGLATLIVLAIPVLSGLRVAAFQAVYESPSYPTLCRYAGAALLFLLGYRHLNNRYGYGDYGDAPWRRFGNYVPDVEEDVNVP